LVDLRVFQGGFVDNFWYACGLVPPPSTVEIWVEGLDVDIYVSYTSRS